MERQHIKRPHQDRGLFIALGVFMALLVVGITVMALSGGGPAKPTVGGGAPGPLKAGVSK